MFGLTRKRKLRQPSAESLVPRVKNVRFTEFASELSNKPDDAPVTRPFVGDLLIAFAFDTPEMFQFVMEHDRKRLGMSLEQIEATAMQNLVNNMPEIQVVREEHGVIGIQTGQHLEACMLLVDEYWEASAQEMPGNIVAAVPTRDLLMVTSSEFPDGIDVLRLVIEQLSQLPDKTHNLSQNLFIREQDRWSVFRDTTRPKLGESKGFSTVAFKTLNSEITVGVRFGASPPRAFKLTRRPSGSEAPGGDVDEQAVVEAIQLGVSEANDANGTSLIAVEAFHTDSRLARYDLFRHCGFLLATAAARAAT